jgi:hypothetical protein
MHKIPGPCLIGFGDMFVGGPAKTPPAKPKVPLKNLAAVPGKKTPIVKPKSTGKTTSRPAIAAAKAADAGKAAIATGKKAAATVQKYEAAVKAGKHSPLVPVVAKKTAVGCFIGAAPGVKLTAVQAKAVDKHTNAIAKGAAANKALNVQAIKATRAGNAALSASGEAARAALKQAGKKVPPAPAGAKTSIRGTVLGYAMALGADGLAQLEDEDLAFVADVLGADASGLLPGMPGYDPSTDPAAGGGTDPYGAAPDPYASSAPLPGPGSIDQSTGAVLDSSGNIVYDPTPDILPPRPDPVPLDLGSVVAYQSPPADAVIYNYKMKPYNAQNASVGSLAFFRGGGSDGFLYNGNPNHNFFEAHRGGKVDHINVWGNYDPPVVDGAQEGKGGDKHTNLLSLKYNWGPLIGNPETEWAGLQMAADGTWFWMEANAPKWATVEADAAAQNANLQMIAAKQQDALTKLAQKAKEAADNAEQLARQQAAQALTQQAAEAAQTLAQTQAATADVTAQQQQDAQMAQQDIEYQKLQDAQDADRAKYELERKRARLAQQQKQAEIDAEYQHALIAEAQQYNEWAAQNPEEAAAQADDGGGEPIDEGGAPVDEEFDDGGQTMADEGLDDI